jgi:hypothetical protein
MIKYINKLTGKEVKYGQNITYHDEGEFPNGYKYESDTTVPIINATIPQLIEKGIIIQKEVKDPENKKGSEKKKEPTPSKMDKEFSVEEKLDIIARSLVCLHDRLDHLFDILLEDDEE